MKCPNCDVDMELFTRFKEKREDYYKYYCEVCGLIYVFDSNGNLVREER